MPDSQPNLGDLEVKQVSWLRLPCQYGSQCPLCFKDYVWRATYLQTNCCGRLFCTSCLNEHTEHNDLGAMCPNCREELLEE